MNSKMPVRQSAREGAYRVMTAVLIGDHKEARRQFEQLPEAERGEAVLAIAGLWASTWRAWCKRQKIDPQTRWSRTLLSTERKRIVHLVEDDDDE